MSDAASWRDPARGLSLRMSPRPTEEALALLRATTWGGGRTRYRILDLDAKLARLRDPVFAHLEASGRLASVWVLDRCRKRVLGRPMDGVHFAMAATTPEQRGRGLGRLIAERLRAWCESELPRPGFAFAYVEQETRISLRIADAIGHSLEADLPLTLFGRLRPRDDPRVRSMTNAERPEVTARLDALHADHAFVDFEDSLDRSECLVLWEDGRVAAAVQTELMRWSVEALPGVAGAILPAALRLLPAAIRPISLSDLHVLRFGNALVEPGREASFLALMEAALARGGARLGLLMMDRRSDILARIVAHGGLGLASRALRGSARFRADFVGLSDEDVAQLRESPVHVSPADVF